MIPLYRMQFNVQKAVSYWVKNAALKWETAKGLKRLKRNADCLFPKDFVWENPLAAEVKQHGIRIRV